MRSVKGVGQWTDETGAMRNAAVEIAIDGATARVTVAALGDAVGEDEVSRDRRVVYFVGKVEQKIRAAQYAARPIVPDPKPKDRKGKHRHANNA